MLVIGCFMQLSQLMAKVENEGERHPNTRNLTTLGSEGNKDWPLEAHPVGKKLSRYSERRLRVRCFTTSIICLHF